MKTSFTKFKTKIIENLPVPISYPVYEEENSEKPDKVENNEFLMPSDLQRPVYVMCPPFSLDTSNPNNALMNEIPPKDRKINKLKAVEQFFAIYSFVSNSALIYLLPSKKGLQDLPYVANLGINLPHTKDNNIILSSFKSEPREGETAVGCEFFENLGYNCIVSPPFFEGEADLKFVNKNNYVGAYGMRTSIEALDWFKKTYDMNIVSVKMSDETMYHLDCIFFPLEDDKAFAITEAFDKQALRAIEKFTEIIPIPMREGKLGVTNCVRTGNLIMNGTTIYAMKKGSDDYDEEKDKNDLLEKLCAKYGYDPVFFNTSEFAKSGAAMSCMFMHLNYPELFGGEH